MHIRLEIEKEKKMETQREKTKQNFKKKIAELKANVIVTNGTSAGATRRGALSSNSIDTHGCSGPQAGRNAQSVFS